MRIRTLLNNTPLTLADLHTAVFAATIAQANQGSWVILTASDEPTTYQALQAFEGLGLFWDEAPDPEESAENHLYTLPNVDPETVAQYDQQHHITHEIVSGSAAPLNPHLQTITLPVLNTGDLSAEALLHDDYLPTAVWHYLLTRGWPAATTDLRLTSYKAKQTFSLDQLDLTPQTLQTAALRTLNQRYIAHLPADLLAEKIKPYLEEWFGAMPAVGRWLIQLAETIRPSLPHFADAPDLAAWAFPDGYELTLQAETLLADETIRPILVSLVAELAHIVLLDPQTAQSILSGLQARYPDQPIDPPILATLTGHTTPLPLPVVMSTLGKAESLTRLGHILN